MLKAVATINRRIDMHQKINRTLATIALALGIVIMLAVIVVGIFGLYAANGVATTVGNLGEDTSTVDPVDPVAPVQPGDPDYEPFCYEAELGEEICE
ncbi:hypothetical protein [Geodermatophilus sp. URMC 65]